LVGFLAGGDGQEDLGARYYFDEHIDFQIRHLGAKLLVGPIGNGRGQGGLAR